MRTLGPLTAADEMMTHQIVDTFATVGQTDRSWTEKVCAMACAKDGSLYLGVGLGKYTNRGVMDGYAAVSRGAEMRIVRASRELGADPVTTSIGPVHYEVLEPLRCVRFSLDPNDAQPIAFEWVFESVVPPCMEHPEQSRSRDGLRLDQDLVRYHQAGVAHGWVSIDGERTEFDADSWVSTRDHSWGVRHGVGTPDPDTLPADRPANLAIVVNWSPIVCERPDGSRYALHWFLQRQSVPGWQNEHFQGGVEHADGSREPFAGIEPEFEVDPVTRRFRRARITFRMSDGSTRPITVEKLDDTGLPLGAGLYFGLDGKFHGTYRGALEVEGEHVADVTEPDAARRLHQLVDHVVRVEDPVGGGVGVGNLQTLFVGPIPDLGLDEASSFL